MSGEKPKDPVPPKKGDQSDSKPPKKDLSTDDIEDHSSKGEDTDTGNGGSKGK